MQTSLVLVGIGGYGGQYVNTLLKETGEHSWRIAGIVDPVADRAAGYAALKALGLPFYNTLDEFYAVSFADLAIIASPIQYHCQQACTAMRHGTNVLCEKPISAVIQEALEMERVSAETGCFCAIGYQWSYSPQLLALKADIMKGRYGAAKRCRTITLWPRNDTYYHRNNWAGALQSPKGDWILDSPVNNATAHYLHNMLFLLGDSINRTAEAVSVQAELYRANDITNYDTAALRVMTAKGAEILFYTTHAVSRLRGPEYLFEFENGTVTFNCRHGRTTGITADGTVTEYGTPVQDVTCKLAAALAAAQGNRDAIVCDATTAMTHTRIMNGAQESVGAPVAFPARDIYKASIPGSQVKVMTGLAQDFELAYAEAKLPGEVAPRPWTKIGQIVDIRGYSQYPRA